MKYCAACDVHWTDDDACWFCGDTINVINAWPALSEYNRRHPDGDAPPGLGVDLLTLLETNCAHGHDYDACPRECEPPRAESTTAA